MKLLAKTLYRNLVTQTMYHRMVIFTCPVFCSIATIRNVVSLEGKKIVQLVKNNKLLEAQNLNIDSKRFSGKQNVSPKCFSI